MSERRPIVSAAILAGLAGIGFVCPDCGFECTGPLAYAEHLKATDHGKLPREGEAMSGEDRIEEAAREIAQAVRIVPDLRDPENFARVVLPPFYPILQRLHADGKKAESESLRRENAKLREALEAAAEHLHDCPSLRGTLLIKVMAALDPSSTGTR